MDGMDKTGMALRLVENPEIIPAEEKTVICYYKV